MAAKDPTLVDATSPPPLDLADAMPHIVWTHDPRGVATYFNRSWTTYTGLDLEETRRVGAETLVHPGDRSAVETLIQQAHANARPLQTTYRLRRKDGAYRAHLARVVPLVSADGEVTGWVGTAMDVEDQLRLAAEQKFLVAASRVLGTSLEVQQTLTDVARLVVPELADWCAIDLLTDAGQLERMAVAHVDPSKVALAAEVWRRLPPRPEDTSGAFGVIRTRTPELFAEITDALLAAAITDPELLAIFRLLGLRSSMCVPLVARDAVLGTLTLVSAESGRTYGQADLAFGEELARRIAIAVDNARLYTSALQARAAAEAIAADVVEQSHKVEAALRAMRAERDDALARVQGRL